jgi:tetratricopeptide (TPR) repeat protein
VSYILKAYDASAVAYREAIGLDKGNPILYLNLGLACSRAGDAKGAEAAFKQSIVAYDLPQIARVYDVLGALYFTQKQYRNAGKAYQSALWLDPGDLEALFYHAVTLDQLKHYAPAKGAYRRFLALAPQNSAQEERRGLAKKRIQLLP